MSILLRSWRHWAVPSRALQAAYPTTDVDCLSTQDKLDLLDKAGLIYWPPKGSVPRQKRYSDENPGVPLQDIVTDIGPISSHAKERFGYPTQKPVELLDRIIRASTHKGDVYSILSADAAPQFTRLKRLAGHG